MLKDLKEGSSFTLDLNRDGRPDTLIERRDGNLIEIIDDSGHASDIANNRSSAAYLVSLKSTGLVDRMIVYIDNDADGKADEMEIRHYQDGYLRYGWFGENYDGDGAQIFALKNWSYAGGSDFSSKFRGNVSIYLNKYDQVSKTWVPLSECPFLFWDQNHDGHGDVVLRVSAAPLNSNKGKDPDYANNYNYMWAANATPLAETGNMNVRFSYNLDPDPRGEPVQHPHYTFGFNMVGSEAYSLPGHALHQSVAARASDRRADPCIRGDLRCIALSGAGDRLHLGRGAKRCSGGKVSSGSTNANTCPTPAALRSAGTCGASSRPVLRATANFITQRSTNAIISRRARRMDGGRAYREHPERSRISIL